MSVTMHGYRPSNPSDAATIMNDLDQMGIKCPNCGRTPKWYYRFYEATSELDSPNRCTLHPINPIPGPARYPDREKVHQYY